MKGARNHFPAAFTLVELMLGLAITVLVLSAMASVLFAVGQGWSANDGRQSLEMQANQTMGRLQAIFSQAKYVGFVNNGATTGTTIPPAGVLYWANDDLTPDGKPQAGELALVEFDPTTHSLFLYRAPSPCGDSRAQTLIPWHGPGNSGGLDDADGPATFKTLAFLAPRKALGGPGDHPDTGTHAWVTQVYFNVKSLSSATEQPAVEYVLTFARGGETVVRYGLTTLRGPAGQPN